jgi:starvation-inducible DNA-binding protein
MSQKLSSDQKQELAQALSKLLADNFALYLKTHNFHWHVTGAHFKMIHEMLGEHYNAIFGKIDEVAERIRALGHRVPASFSEFTALSKINEVSTADKAKDMLAELINDHKTACDTALTAQKLAEKYDDYTTQGMACDCIELSEQIIWMYKESINY